jgi:deoxycytidine triphosphate deaminase
MYLSDNDIRALLPELGIQTPQAAHPFDANAQIQPCSIDLRVSDVFWTPSRRLHYWHRLTPWRAPTVDLRYSKMHELDPRRDWKRLQLSEGETLTIKPRQVVMARIYERFRIPPSFAGKIEGRSSFARLGLFVHCSGDFINPGWNGFMPLQLFNAGSYPIQLTPYISICQLKLVSLTSEPSRVYGDADLQSKYVNDDGGPSFWWRDRQIKTLQARLGEINVAERIQADIIERVRFANLEVVDRFEHFVQTRRLQSIENADELLDSFAEREGWRQRLDQVSKAFAAVMASGTIGTFFVHPVGLLHILVWIVTVASLVLAARGAARGENGYLTKAVLSRASRA